jgi:hypothetical protein
MKCEEGENTLGVADLKRYEILNDQLRGLSLANGQASRVTSVSQHPPLRRTSLGGQHSRAVR